jgi:hypothetical protein
MVSPNPATVRVISRTTAKPPNAAAIPTTARFTPVALFSIERVAVLNSAAPILAFRASIATLSLAILFILSGRL